MTVIKSVPKVVDVAVPVDLLETAMNAAEAAFGKRVTPAIALSWCVSTQTEAAMQAVADTLSAKAKAMAIAHTVAALQCLGGPPVELREREGQWWIAAIGGGEGYPIGTLDKNMVFAEIERLGTQVH